jgi:hypothetical protein
MTWQGQSTESTEHRARRAKGLRCKHAVSLCCAVLCPCAVLCFVLCFVLPPGTDPKGLKASAETLRLNAAKDGAGGSDGLCAPPSASVLASLRYRYWRPKPGPPSLRDCFKKGSDPLERPHVIQTKWRGRRGSDPFLKQSLKRADLPAQETVASEATQESVIPAPLKVLCPPASSPPTLTTDSGVRTAGHRGRRGAASILGPSLPALPWASM